MNSVEVKRSGLNQDSEVLGIKVNVHQQCIGKL